MLTKKANALFKELVTDKGKKQPTALDRYKLITKTNTNWCSKTKKLMSIEKFDEDPTSDTGYKNYCRDAATSQSGFSRSDFLPPEGSTTEQVVVHFNKAIKKGIEEGKFQRLPKVLMDLISEYEDIKYSSQIQHVYIPHKKPSKKPAPVKAKAVTKRPSIQKKTTRKKKG